ncbi:hypothetical protein HNR39_000391 [Glaciimonas immobilis]|uniref:Uncharacterized protein n=1 Tax=Glaciimonas immobilis TaxID=728004 RepID=A0A840RPN2_9BURK|nr:hypothetical protein [Glaciimonas immobilis]
MRNKNDFYGTHDADRIEPEALQVFKRFLVVCL